VRPSPGFGVILPWREVQRLKIYLQALALWRDQQLGCIPTEEAWRGGVYALSEALISDTPGLALEWYVVLCTNLGPLTGERPVQQLGTEDRPVPHS
jgi:hypothetical protein